MRTRATFVVLAALLLAGCGEGDSEPAAGEAPASVSPEGPAAGEAPAGGPGLYAFEYAGAVGSVMVPTPADDARVQEVEAYREAAGAEPVTYVVAEVDNTAGTDDVNMYSVVVVTEDGQQVELMGISDLLGEWMGEGSTDYNRGVRLSNEHRFFLRPGAVGTAVLAVEGELSSDPARVYVLPAGGMTEVEATRLEGLPD